MSDSNKVFEKALELIADGKVSLVDKTDELIWGTVMSSEGEPFTPFITKGSGGTCGCVSLAMNGGFCKHTVAVLLSIPHHELVAWVARGD